jgi:dethiobiotin synthetase
MGQGFFITGTDTEIGKTTASLVLMRAFKQQGYQVAGMKPVAAGCRITPQGLRNDDAEKLLEESSLDMPYDLINPFAFEPAIAPHIAAEQTNQPITIEVITNAYKSIASRSDIVVVEGIGGWAVPINERQTMADVAKALDLPIILVAGIRLGCLNHTLLTYSAIASQPGHGTAWIANLLGEPDPVSAQNIEYLKQTLPLAYLGTIPYYDQNSQLNPANMPLNISLLNL